jgi:hypothetical protein
MYRQPMLGDFGTSRTWKKVKRIAYGKVAANIFDLHRCIDFGIGAAVVRVKDVPVAEMAHASVYASPGDQVVRRARWSFSSLVGLPAFASAAVSPIWWSSSCNSAFFSCSLRMRSLVTAT